MIIDCSAVTQGMPIDLGTGKPYLSTVAAIQVSANGVNSEVLPYMARVVEVTHEPGLPQEANALLTNVEGDLGDALKVAGEAVKELAEQGYRISLMLYIDIHPGLTSQLTEKPKLVDEILADKRTEQQSIISTSKGTLCYYTSYGAVTHPWGDKTLMGR